jgi:hypothetical protein
MIYEAKIEKLFEKSNDDKCGGISAGVYILELYESLDKDEKKGFIEEINKILYTSNKKKLLKYSWLVFSLSKKITKLDGSKEVIVARIMKEYTVANPDKKFISDLEEFVILIDKRMKKQRNRSFD